MPISLRGALIATLLAAGPSAAQASPPWTDLGFGLAGSQGVPALVGTGSLLPSSSVSLTLTGAHVSIDAWVVIGLQVLQAPYKGGTMVPEPQLIVPIVTNPVGTSQVDSVWPPGLAGGTLIWFQCWILDPVAPKGLAASNALLATTP